MNAHRLAIRALLSLTMFSACLAAHSQDAVAKPSDCSKLTNRTEQIDCSETHLQTKTIYLKNITTQNDANEIMVAVRNLLDPNLKIYLLASQEAIVLNTYPEQMARAEALIKTLDLPRKTYRLTYTITELDGGKTIGTQHLSMVVVDGQRSTAKEGTKVPVATGSFSTDNNASQTQFTYLDVGMNIDSTVTGYDNGTLLKAKVEQSSIGQSSTIAGVTEPIVSQTVFEGVSLLTVSKPIMLGSVDVPSTTRRLDIAVVIDAIH